MAAFCFGPAKVGKVPYVCTLMLAYDDLYSIEYLGHKLRPYWRRNGADAAALLRTAAKDYQDLSRRCDAFDRRLTADLIKVGGPGYANLCALAYREAIGAHKLAAAPDGRPMLFPKENFSNGCIATVDVTYPAAPIFALFSNDLLKASVAPVLDYAASGRWKFDFAPHDLGTYPKADGQVYGGGERTERDQMPVEESGNLLLVAAVIAELDGNTKYAQRLLAATGKVGRLSQAEGARSGEPVVYRRFRRPSGPQRQPLSEGDPGPGRYAKMCTVSGRPAEAAEYRRTAEGFAKQWVKLARRRPFPSGLR